MLYLPNAMRCFCVMYLCVCKMYSGTYVCDVFVFYFLYICNSFVFYICVYMCNVFVCGKYFAEEVEVHLISRFEEGQILEMMMVMMMTMTMMIMHMLMMIIL